MFRRERIRSEVWTQRCWAMLLLAILSMMVPARAVTATDWAKAMFDHTTHDFGMVPRGSEAEHRFTVDNIYLEDAHIKSVSSTCKCTDVAVTTPALKTHEKSQIVATLNTRQFTGSKDATIRVVFDKPFPAVVQLHVHSYIRTDVVLEPGSVQFGQVTEGSKVTKTLTLRHAGNPDWKITGQEKEDPDIDLSIKPVAANSGQSTYELAFTLKPTAAAGYIRRHITLLTNDQNPNAQRVLVAMEGVVAPALSVRPSPVAFGHVPVGREVTRNIVVKGDEVFQILELAGPDDRFRVPPAKLKTPARLHVLPVSFAAGTEPGKLKGEIVIRTDIGDGRILRVDVSGEVVGSSKIVSPAADAADRTDDSPVAQKETPDGWRRAKQ